MALQVVMHKFKIELSNVDLGVYESFELRLALHPSESATYLLTRVLAYCLNFREGLEFSPQGLADPEAPAIRAISATGAIELWIEIGSPSAKRVHKASKAADQVKIYTYKDVKALGKELLSQSVHQLSEIEIFALKSQHLDALEKDLGRDNKWSVLIHDGALTVSILSSALESSHHLALERHTIT